ncbi:MAG: hypothetical protein ACOC2U_02790 [bacterium]
MGFLDYLEKKERKENIKKEVKQEEKIVEEKSVVEEKKKRKVDNILAHCNTILEGVEFDDSKISLSSSDKPKEKKNTSDFFKHVGRLLK